MIVRIKTMSRYVIYLVISILIGCTTPGNITKSSDNINSSADGRYQVFANNVILDTKTGLEWYVGPNENTEHYQVEKWVKGLTIAGGGWRMPTMSELRAIFEKDKATAKSKYFDVDIHLDPVFKTTEPWIWSSELLNEDGNTEKEPLSHARYICFACGNNYSNFRHYAGNLRGFAVRSGKHLLF